MKTLFEQFQEAKAAIMDPAGKGKFHYPLIDIMRAAANGAREYNPQAIAAAGIDPDDFMTAWAVGWAKSALAQHGETHKMFHENMITCCLKAISMEPPHAFGHYLPEPYQTLIREKLAKVGVETPPYTPAPVAPVTAAPLEPAAP